MIKFSHCPAGFCFIYYFFDMRFVIVILSYFLPFMSYQINNFFIKHSQNSFLFF